MATRSLPSAPARISPNGTTISGNAFEVMESVDAVGSDFVWDLGAGHCGKGQAAKVDDGGPHIRCKLTIGGEQNA